MTVTLRPVRADDFTMLLRWYNAPHLRPFYMWGEPMTEQQLIRKFTPRLDPAHGVRCRIAETDGAPYGYIQWYPSADWSDSGAMLAGLSGTCSADYFIGDAGYLGHGLASAMLRATFVEVTMLMPAHLHALCIAHDDRNVNAIRAALAAGYVAEGQFIEKGMPGTVYVRRAQAAPLA